MSRWLGSIFMLGLILMAVGCERRDFQKEAKAFALANPPLKMSEMIKYEGVYITGSYAESNVLKMDGDNGEFLVHVEPLVWTAITSTHQSKVLKKTICWPFDFTKANNKYLSYKVAIEADSEKK